MSNWSSYQFTRKGEQLRAKVEAGKCKLTLTKIKIGNGSVTLGDIKDMSDLKSPQLVLGISSCAVSAEDDRVCEVVGIASSSNVENAFSVTEMGLYANDPDVGEILYLVEIDTSPDDMPNKNAQSPMTLTYQIELVTSNTANVTAMVSPAGLVTVKMMSAHRTAAELDHPEKSVHKKHLHQDAYESPALTGIPTAPTAGHGTNNEQIANTAFVAQAIAGKVSKTGDTMIANLNFSGANIGIQGTHGYMQFGGNDKGDAIESNGANVNIASWWGLGLYDLCDKRYTGTMDLRSGNWRTVGKMRADQGFEGNLTGTASNSNTLGGQSLQWIIDQIGTAKTGIVSTNLAENGWVKFANGLILQWGIVKNGMGTQKVSFPISFSSKVFHINFSSTIAADGAVTNSAVQSYRLTGAELYGNTSPAGHILWFVLGI